VLYLIASNRGFAVSVWHAVSLNSFNGFEAERAPGDAYRTTKEKLLKFLAQRVQPEPADNFLEAVRYTEKNRG